MDINIYKNRTKAYLMRFQVFMAASMKMVASWVVSPCSPVQVY
jgi:hypothetical protein